MGYLPGFEEDVFISYAHNDDDSVGPEKEGWVAQLHHDLAERVRVHLGKEPRVWRDCDIRNNEDFSKKILSRLERTATLLSIISPSFAKREWCLREVQEFIANAERTFGVRIDEEKFRIFKAEKVPIPPNVLPPQLQQSGSYRFYGPDPEHRGRVHEFRPMLGGQYSLRYFQVVDELAGNIAELLKAMEQKAQGAPSPVAPGLAVYLAEPASDLQDAANEIRRDLKDRGYVVLPPGDLPYRVRDLREMVQDWLKRSVLSVHMIGNEYGIVPEGETEKSMAWLQHDLAMARSADPDFARLIWMPNDVTPSDLRQLRFMEYLQEDPAAQAGADVLRTKLENLKVTLEEKLREIQEHREKKPAPAETSNASVGQASGEPVRIYLICDRLDRNSNSLLALRKFLFDQGFEPMLPAECDDEREALQAHADNLELCDACLIYYGQGSDKWFQTKLMDFRKILRLRLQPVRAKAVYLAPPETPSKSELQTHEAMVLRGTDTFSAGVLGPFVSQLSGAARGGRA